jgi:hypothetical protein
MRFDQNYRLNENKNNYCNKDPPFLTTSELLQKCFLVLVIQPHTEIARYGKNYIYSVIVTLDNNKIW